MIEKGATVSAGSCGTLLWTGVMSGWLRYLGGTISELVERRTVTGCETEPLLGLVARMREAGASVALITGAEGRVTGLLTADDLLQLVLFPLEPVQPVAALRRRVPALREQDRIYQAIAEMRRQRRSCLPVADAVGRPAGLIRLEAVLGFPLVAQLDAAVIGENQTPPLTSKRPRRRWPRPCWQQANPPSR